MTAPKKKAASPMTTEDPVVILSLSQIEEIDDITEENLYVDAWKGHVRIRSISKRQMNRIKKDVREETNGEPDQATVEKHILMEGLVEPKIDSATYEKWLDKSAVAVEQILNGILGQSRAKGKEDVKKEERQFRS